MTVDCTNSIALKNTNPAVMTYTKDYVTNGKSALLTSAAYNALYTLTFPNDCWITSFDFLKSDGSVV